MQEHQRNERFVTTIARGQCSWSPAGLCFSKDTRSLEKPEEQQQRERSGGDTTAANCRRSEIRLYDSRASSGRHPGQARQRQRQLRGEDCPLLSPRHAREPGTTDALGGPRPFVISVNAIWQEDKRAEFKWRSWRTWAVPPNHRMDASSKNLLLNSAALVGIYLFVLQFHHCRDKKGRLKENIDLWLISVARSWQCRIITTQSQGEVY